jgi:hypothetical protein
MMIFSGSYFTGYYRNTAQYSTCPGTDSGSDTGTNEPIIAPATAQLPMAITALFPVGGTSGIFESDI